MDLGFLAAQRCTLDTLRPELQTAILSAPSGFGRLCAFRRLAGREDSALVFGLAKERDSVRIWCDLAAFPTSPALACSDWLQLQGMVATIRDLVARLQTAGRRPSQDRRCRLFGRL
jgi:hypothetical protein